MMTKEEVIETLEKLLRVSKERRDACKINEVCDWELYEGKRLAYQYALYLVKEIK